MKNSQTPTFSSPELQKVVAAAKPVLEGVDEARNRVSNDIKTLETYLQSLDLRTSFRHPTGECFFPEDDRVAAAALEYVTARRCREVEWIARMPGWPPRLTSPQRERRGIAPRSFRLRPA